MATGWPMKTTYANGDVYSASDVNDITGTINLLGKSVAYTAGKNAILNSDFRIWQRGTSFSVSGYNADRWTTLSLQAGDTVTQQTFTPGTAPVAGYEGLYYLRLSNSALAGTRYFLQRIEDVRTLAGQTVTLSFWAKASASATLTSVVGGQNFGTGGSSFNNGTSQSNTLTTSWQRFTQTATISSVSGKTIGTGSYLEQAFQYANTSVNYDIWGVQLEIGSTATAFQTATGTIQGELAACQRYYEKTYSQGTNPATATFDGLTGSATGSSNGTGYFFNTSMFRVTKRGVPTVTIYDTSGNSGKVTKVDTGGTNTANTTATASLIGDGSFRSFINGTSAIGFYFHYVADAEL